jgi:putative iron-regulated protein
LTWPGNRSSEQEYTVPLLTSRRLVAGILVASLLAAAACGDDSGDDGAEGPEATEQPAKHELADADALAAATTYADLVVKSYDDTIAATEPMNAALKAFVAAPSDATLQAAKDAWKAARVLYGQTEVYRFYDGPIDDPDHGPEGEINSWPLDEAYLDYVEGSPDAGIINDTAAYPEITTAVLTEANTKGGEENISTGWHAIEFLLWGQDLSATGPGARPVSDYTTSPTAQRRGTYLTLLGDLLVKDLREVRDQWDPADGTYRTTFLADPHQAVADILRGMGALSSAELAGERISVALDTKDQEDEHSCFSDNTTVDILENATGIQNAYLGTWPGVTGPSLSSIVAKVEPDLDAQLKAMLADTVAKAQALKAPFDQLILGDDAAPGRVELQALVTALQDQGKAIAQLAGRLGYQVSLVVD